MKKELLKIGIRNKAIYIPDEIIKNDILELKSTTVNLIANAKKLGFAFSEKLLRAVNNVTPGYKTDVLEVLKDITGVNKNWTPLVKEWNIPTGENFVDHIYTFIANVFGTRKGTTLQCGHIIPENTFPLERYNGCPYCGTPFEFGEIENYGQGSKLKILELWDNDKMVNYFGSLLSSKTALDATQAESLKALLNIYPLPGNPEIGIKETLVLVVDSLIEYDKENEAAVLFKTPTDILRYLWYKHTGFLQIIEPKTIIKRKSKNSAHLRPSLDHSGKALLEAKAELKLKYNRTECRRVAFWLNELPLSAKQACEIMHPKRNMWVRFIRALRLSEYSKKKGFKKLAELMDVFYNETYDVVQGKINHYRLKMDAENTFALLKKRPGLFVRSLFSNMLWFGNEITLKHFKEIIHDIPARLVLTLNMYAEYYFDRNVKRAVKPLGGTSKSVPANKLLQLYTDEQLKKMQEDIKQLSIEVIKHRFEKSANDNKTIYIDESLYKIPLAIGDRSESVQDLPVALTGSRFPVEGNTIRLFLQWGVGLSAQHLDMDLSCNVAYEKKTNFCSYSQLVIPGCKHSGDIQHIPDKIGTAEYIDVDIKKLEEEGAVYVSFTCNAYTYGSLSPNLVVGWMDSKYPMKISKETGVAYDPSSVQHQVRITQTLSKGLVFGVLDIAKKEIIWLELSFGGQIVQNLNFVDVKNLLAKLESKLSIGELLAVKAQAQHLEIIDNKDNADEVYNMTWAIDPAALTQLFLD